MAIEVGPRISGRFVAKVPGQPDVIAIGEMVEQAQMRTAVVALRVKVFAADDANDRVAARQWRSAIELTRRLRRLL